MAGFRLSLGADYQGQGLTRFRVWAPDRRRVDVALQSRSGLAELPLQPEGQGYFGGTHSARPGDLYKLKLDGGEAYPDPCSRFQPQGPHGPSQIVDPTSYLWRDGGWPGRTLERQVIYELHVGAFTKEGTYRALQAELPYLRELGVTLIELMPLAAFPGRFNWGYDGVALFSPCAVYGTPDELRALVDAAHELGLGVLLDVVYNHLGPDGNYLAQFAKDYFTDRYPNEWGQSLNFDGERSGPVRDFFRHNAAYWISEFHLDGLRLDATQSLHDASPTHIVAEVVSAARAAAGQRSVVVVAENEPQDVRMVLPPSQGGLGVDALWVDDFHHAARVALTGNAEAYCMDYRGEAQELLSCALRNSLFQGQWDTWQKRRRGTPLRRAPARQAIFYLQNHDQLANTLRAQRIHVVAGEATVRAMSTFLLLLPQTPMLFMGQEFFASSPFLYFVDHNPQLQALVENGRREFLSQFASARCAFDREGYRPPFGQEAFERSKLILAERQAHQPALDLHRALLALRRSDPMLSGARPFTLSGAALSPQALVLRYDSPDLEDARLLLLNLGSDLRFDPCPEPLLAPLPGRIWRLVLSSEDTRYGGRGCDWPTGEGPWRLAAQCALVLAPEEA